MTAELRGKCLGSSSPSSECRGTINKVFPWRPAKMEARPGEEAAHTVFDNITTEFATYEKREKFNCSVQ